MTVRNVQSILYTPPGGTTVSGSSDSTTPLQDFTTLLASEISNEDPNNPVSSTDMVSQYAQIQAAAGMNQLVATSQTYQYTQTAADLLNQTVTVVVDPTTNQTITGTVKGIDFSQSVPQVDVDGTMYPLSAVATVGQ